MKIDEAIEIIQEAIEVVEKEAYWFKANNLKKVIKMLEKQKPVEPKKTITYNGFHYDYCGSCSRLLPVAQDFEKAQFCPHCGVKVEWNEDLSELETKQT